MKKGKQRDPIEGEEQTGYFQESHVEPKDYQCGLFSWRPQCLQPFVRPIYFTAVYLLYGIFQGALKTGLNSSMTTIERKYSMSGKMISMVMIMDNITGTLASLIAGFYAMKVSRPRILVFGVWMSILSCFFFVLPHLLYGGVGVNTDLSKTSKGPSTNSRFTEFCNMDANNEMNASVLETHSKKISLADDHSFTLPVLLLFSIGNMVNGIGGTAFYIAGVTYTDDNVKKKNSPIYFGAILSLRMVGPLLGVITNSYFLTINEHPFSPPTGMTTRDPRWIGAWWLPFAGWGVLMTLVSIPLVLFPKNIRSAPGQVRKTPIFSSELGKPDPTSLWDKIVVDCKVFGETLKRLSKNRVFVWQNIGYIFIVNGIGGHMMNLPKYIEIQYRVSAAKASFLTGSTKVMAMIIAAILGGVALRIFKPTARTICLWAVFADFVNIIVLVASIYLPCDNWKLSGTSFVEDRSLTFLSPCNEACGCLNKFQPFCDKLFNKSYFSPCFGGCSSSNLTSMDCNCLETSGQSDGSRVSFLNDATRYLGGFCRNDCSNMTIFILITTASKFISTLPRVGSMLVSLRCVAPADKALAMGVTGSLVNILDEGALICDFIQAAVPYPLIYGALFDTTCLVWAGRNGQKGNCWYYESDLLRHRFLGLTVFFYAIGTVCFILMSYYAKDVGNLYDDDDAPKNLNKNHEAESMDPKANRP